jgi:hypothetical protein
VASLLGVAVASIGIVGALMIWHLVRRGRLLRARLAPPRDVWLPRVDRPPPKDAGRSTNPEGEALL